MYHEQQAENPDELSKRNIESMKGLFKRLNENACKWLAACSEVAARKKSGMSEKDVEKEAHTIYEAGGTKFQDINVFNEVMCKHPKWDSSSIRKRRFVAEDGEDNNEESGGSSKRAKTSEDAEYSTPSQTPSTGRSTISRLMDRDKVKKMEKIHALRLSKDNEVEVFKSVATAKIEFEREKMLAANKKMNKILLNTLWAKDHLTPAQEELADQLIKELRGK